MNESMSSKIALTIEQDMIWWVLGTALTDHLLLDIQSHVTLSLLVFISSKERD